MKLISRAKQLAPPVVYRLTRHPDSYLSYVNGVIHVGAHTGQERQRYDRFGLNVLWVEAIPWVFDELRQNLQAYPQQLAVNALVADVAGELHEFHVADNDGQSSSILDLKDHRKIWPDVGFERRITLESVTLPMLLDQYEIDVSDYGALVLDTQGSELLVLKGSSSILGSFQYVKTEVADFEAYEGCVQLPELEAFLSSHGFVESVRVVQATLEGVGTYYEILYEREG